MRKEITRVMICKKITTLWICKIITGKHICNKITAIKTVIKLLVQRPVK
jgi:hypothetical protein